jgi:hypothetical protein
MALASKEPQMLSVLVLELGVAYINKKVNILVLTGILQVRSEEKQKIFL